MKDLLLTLLHLTVMTATLCGPGGVRVVSVNWWKSRKRVIIRRGDRAYAACFIPSMS